MTVPPSGAAAVQSAREQFDRASEKFQKAASPPLKGPAELSSAAVDLLVAQRGFAAAIRLAQIEDQIANETLKVLDRNE